MSANNTYLTTTSELTAVADAIRAKAGTASALEYPTEFVSTISAIEVGGGGLPSGAYGIDILEWDTPSNPNSISRPKTITIHCATASSFVNTMSSMFSNEGSTFWGSLNTVSSITVDDGDIDTIPTSMFNGTELTTMPPFDYSKIHYVRDNAFRNIQNGGLGTADLTLPNVIQIGQYAFGGNFLLNSITIGTYGNSNLTGISNNAFRNANRLREINILETPSSIGAATFSSAGTSAGVTPVMNVVWSEGTVANAPWGFSGTINYDYNPEL